MSREPQAANRKPRLCTAGVHGASCQRKIDKGRQIDRSLPVGALFVSKIFVAGSDFTLQFYVFVGKIGGYFVQAMAAIRILVLGLSNQGVGLKRGARAFTKPRSPESWVPVAVGWGSEDLHQQ